MRITPKMKPWAAAVATSTAGISKTDRASATATSSPLNAETHTRFFSATRTKKSVSTGRAETAVDNSQLPNGSYICCHVINGRKPPVRWRHFQVAQALGSRDLSGAGDLPH